MKILLALACVCSGPLAAMALCMAIGFVLASPLALLALGRQKGNWWLLILYVAGAAMTGGIFWGLLSFARWAAHTTGANMTFAFWAAFCFPGIFALKIIPSAVTTATKQINTPPSKW